MRAQQEGAQVGQDPPRAEQPADLPRYKTVQWENEELKEVNSTFKTEIKNISSCVFTFINKTRVESVPTVSLPPSLPHHLCLEGGGAGVGGDQGEVPEGAGHHLLLQ